VPMGIHIAIGALQCERNLPAAQRDVLFSVIFCPFVGACCQHVTKEGIRGRRGTIPGRVTLVGELNNVHTKQGLPSWLGED